MAEIHGRTQGDEANAAKSAWENTDYYWMRAEVGSDEYMQALADHFVVADQDGSMRILRKSKAPTRA